MRRLAALVVRIFFRRVAILGTEHVPPTGPLLVLLNHPNSLVDPIFVLGLAPRRVVFLAKEPLFRLPVIGALARAMGSIPVYRKMDGADTSQNRRTFERVWQELARGGAIALFPEGTSHSDPTLRPFKTGSARMALGAASLNSGPPVSVVPCGLYYTAKVTFRSSAVLRFGPPITIGSEPLDGDGEPDPESVRALTARLQEALAQVTLQADREEALALVTRAERIFSSAAGPGMQDRDLERQFDLRRRLLGGYAYLRAHIPDEIARLEVMLRRYDAELSAAGLVPENLLESRLTVGTVTRNAVLAVGALLLLAPIAAVGWLVNIVPYRLLVPLITHAAKVERDVIATAKILASLAAFPLTWTVIAACIGWRYGIVIATAAWLAMPVTGYAAVLFFERLDRLAGAARGLSLRLLRPRAFRRLEGQRRAIREAILQLDRELSSRTK